MALDVIECARKYIAKMPDLYRAKDHPQDSHAELFTAACVLVKGFDLMPGEAVHLLAEYAQRSDEPWSAAEIDYKIRQADTVPDEKPRGSLRPVGRSSGSGEPRPPSRASSSPAPVCAAPKAEFKPEALKRFAARWREHVDTAWLADRSPVPPYRLGGPISADDYLRAVFREGEKVVVFTNQQSQGQAIWPLQALPSGGDEGVWYLAQPVDGRERVNPRAGLDKDGRAKRSRRSEESVTAWRHLVLESDTADARDWMGALVQLPLRIVAIYTSGGRSIHALVRVDAPTKQEWDNQVKQIRPVLVTLGADPAAMSAVRLTRLPGCMRGGKLQKLLFLNPEPAAAPICTLPRVSYQLDSLAAFLEPALAMAPADMHESGDWQSVESAAAALKWFESNAGARSLLGRVTKWMSGGNDERRMTNDDREAGR